MNKQKINRVNNLVDELKNQGRTADLEKELKNIEHDDMTPEEQESWFYMHGIAAFLVFNEQEALKRFQEAYKRFPKSADIRFSLGQQFIRTNAPDQGFELFKTALFPEISKGYALMEAKYAYLWNHFDDGKFFIRPFFKGYKQLKILDSTFLHMRGMPFFNQWWGYLAAFSVLLKDYKELETVTEFVTKNCHDYDFEFLNLELIAYKEDKPELLIPLLEKNSSGDGYTQMMIAVANAHNASSIEEVEKILKAVQLSENDFSWLEDVRTLAKAKAAHQFGKTMEEQELTQLFLKRQPMIFEPDVALNFHLLRYQEKLKSKISMK